MKKQKKNEKNFFFFLTLSFNLVKVQDCCQNSKTFWGILQPIIRFRPWQVFILLVEFDFWLRLLFFFFLIFNWECAIRLLSLRKFYFCLPCILTHSTSVVIRHFILFIYLFYFYFIFYLFIFFSLGGQFWGFL